jgi:hypothetical protein
VFWHASAWWSCSTCTHGEAVLSPNFDTELELRAWTRDIRVRHGGRPGFELSPFRREVANGSYHDVDLRAKTPTPSDAARQRVSELVTSIALAGAQR